MYKNVVSMLTFTLNYDFNVHVHSDLDKKKFPINKNKKALYISHPYLLQEQICDTLFQGNRKI